MPSTNIEQISNMMKCVTIKGSGARRLRSGGLWVYANEIQDRLPDYQNGELVRVLAPDGTKMGTGYVEPRSLIALRLVARSEETIDRTFLVGRVLEADAARKRLITSSVYRAIFSEADRLPGFVVDRYGDVLSVQLLTWGAELLRGPFVEALREVFGPRAIVIRNENDSRRELGLPTENEYLTFDAAANLERHSVELLGLSLVIDFTNVQKTGLYLDQVATYRTVAGMDFSGLTGADLFCYSGIFGMLAAKRGALRVAFVDSSESALSVLEENLERNGISKERYDIVRSDVLSYLGNSSEASHGFLFVDPPKFIKSRKSYYAGLQGYFNLNRSAVRALADGGLLFTFSCSHHAGETVFRSKVLDAVAKAGCTAREIYHFRQNADHAVLLPMEESFYLKGLLLAIARS